MPAPNPFEPPRSDLDERENDEPRVCVPCARVYMIGTHCRVHPGELLLDPLDDAVHRKLVARDAEIWTRIRVPFWTAGLLLGAAAGAGVVAALRSTVRLDIMTTSIFVITSAVFGAGIGEGLARRFYRLRHSEWMTQVWRGGALEKFLRREAAEAQHRPPDR